MYLKNKKFVKIIKIFPIHFELKSEFEKKAILNAYRAFLKNCNFDMQIIIQSSQENLSENIQKLEERKTKEICCNNLFMVNIFNQYIRFIQEKNKEKIASFKNFYLIIYSKEFPENQKERAIAELSEKYLKIKEALTRCGNQVEEIKSVEEIKKIINSFLYQKGSGFIEN